MKKLLIGTTLSLVLMTYAQAVNYEKDIAPTIKFIEQQKVSNSTYQNFIWDQEKINSLQFQQNKGQEEFNSNQIEFNNFQKTFNEAIIDRLKNLIKSNIDYSEVERLSNKIRSLESDNDKLRSTINKLDSRLYSLEKKVK